MPKWPRASSRTRAGAPDQVLGLAGGPARAAQELGRGALVGAVASLGDGGRGREDGLQLGGLVAQVQLAHAARGRRRGGRGGRHGDGRGLRQQGAVVVGAQGRRGRHVPARSEEVGEVVGAVHERVRRGRRRRAPPQEGRRLEGVEALADLLAAADGGHGGRGDALADGAGGDGRPLAAAAHREAEGRARDQDHRGHQADDDQEGRAEAAHGAAGGPVAGLAEVAAPIAQAAVEPVLARCAAQAQGLGGERDQERRGADRQAQPHRPGGEDRVVEDQGDAERDEDGGRERHGLPHEQAQPVLEPAPEGPGAEAEEQGDAQEDPERDEGEPGELAGLCVTGGPTALGAPRGAAATCCLCDLRADLTPPGCATCGRRPVPGRFAVGGAVPAAAAPSRRPRRPDRGQII